MVDRPRFTLLAGPNGSGKSTISATMASDARVVVVDPDAIARAIDEVQPSRASIPASRQAILRCRRLLEKREGFILESTLAGNGAISFLRAAKLAGFETHLVYVCLGDPALHIERVRLRVAQGGHDVPSVDVLRRYERSLRRVPEAIRLADEAILVDNSQDHPEKVVTIRSGRVVALGANVPAWAATVLNNCE